MSQELLMGIQPLSKGIRLLGVTLSNLETSEEAAGKQLALLL
ncbi:hypothetical protein [Hymenobacter sp. 5516J-16]|nr:hypothetical protein [Hymenobacter sp. 5516J-16]